MRRTKTFHKNFRFIEIYLDKKIDLDKNHLNLLYYIANNIMIIYKSKIYNFIYNFE